MSPTFSGSYVALPTPFTGAGTVDLDAFRGLVELHAAAATRGIVVCGTTGEAATLSERERCGLVDAAVEYAAGRLQVVAGVGTNATRTSVALARFAASRGVDGLLVVTPYYNRPSRRGLVDHLVTVAEATEAPVMLYNVPTRTGTDLLPEWAREVARRSANVVAIKEATRDPDRIRAVCGVEELAVLCGEDLAIAEFVRAGATGTVSVVANLLPDAVAELVEAARPRGDPARADALAARLGPLARSLFVETNPVPVKAALARMGHCKEHVRSPLAPLEETSRTLLADTLTSYGKELPAPALTSA